MSAHFTFMQTTDFEFGCWWQHYDEETGELEMCDQSAVYYGHLNDEGGNLFLDTGLEKNVVTFACEEHVPEPWRHHPADSDELEQ